MRCSLRTIAAQLDQQIKQTFVGSMPDNKACETVAAVSWALIATHIDALMPLFHEIAERPHAAYRHVRSG
jgi:hypothetical protein